MIFGTNCCDSFYYHLRSSRPITLATLSLLAIRSRSSFLPRIGGHFTASFLRDASLRSSASVTARLRLSTSCTIWMDLDCTRLLLKSGRLLIESRALLTSFRVSSAARLSSDALLWH